MRALVVVSGLLGGLCWVGCPLAGEAGWGGRPDGPGTLLAVGAALLALAVLGAGARLVSRGAVALRLLVAGCFLVLVASVLQVLRSSLDQDLVVVGAGGAAVLAALVALARRPAPAGDPGRPDRRAGPGHRDDRGRPGRRRGAHAA